MKPDGWAKILATIIAPHCARVSIIDWYRIVQLINFNEVISIYAVLVIGAAGA